MRIQVGNNREEQQRDEHITDKLCTYYPTGTQWSFYFTKGLHQLVHV